MKKIFSHFVLAFIFASYVTGCTSTYKNFVCACECEDNAFECSVLGKELEIQ